MGTLLQEFKENLDKIQKYKQAIEIFSWDMQTDAPKESIESKIDAIGFFSTELFRLTTSARYGYLLRELSMSDDFDSFDAGTKLTIKRYLKEYKRFTRVPEKFFTEFTKAKARSEQAWEEAKTKNDFSIYAPHLDKVISMTKEWVKYMEPSKDTYDVLIDMYEEGMDSESIDILFDELKKDLVPLIEKISKKPIPDVSIFNNTFEIYQQKKVQDILLKYIGFNFDCGNTSLSMHPFTTTLCPGDIRVTNNFGDPSVLDPMFSAIHEGGHAIFEQNIAKELQGTAAAEVDLMGLHESQSRFFENILGRNINFWIPLLDDIKKAIPGLENVSLETLEQAINLVKPGPVRLQADEMTYCLHIILRYEIEKAIFRDNVEANELPSLWNKKTKELLGVEPSSDAEGILQDMHWSDGSFGYFPSYLLGSIYDGMFLEELEKELGSVDTILKEGRIKEITKWLNDNIHKNGSLYTSKEVIERLCKKEISAKPIIKYFTQKYTRIYNL